MDIAAQRANELDRELEAAHAAVLDRLAPGTQSHRVRWSQGETRVLELGSGPPLLLIHGGFDNAALWAPILTELAARRTGRRRRSSGARTGRSVRLRQG